MTPIRASPFLAAVLLAGCHPTPVDEVYRRVMDITGRDPLPYGIEPNRAMLQEVIDSALEQKVLTAPVTIEELFPAQTHSLVG